MTNQLKQQQKNPPMANSSIANQESGLPKMTIDSNALSPWDTRSCSVDDHSLSVELNLSRQAKTQVLRGTPI